MYKNMSVYRILALIVAVIFAFSITASASTVNENLGVKNKYSFAQAKEYLVSFSDISINEDGGKVITYYSFADEENLNIIAQYISEHGLEKFQRDLDAALKRAISTEELNRTQKQVMRTTPTTKYAYVKGNGTHSVRSSASGLIKFNKVGAVEYLVELSYKAVVSGGKFVSKKNVSFDIPYISTGGTWGKVSLPGYIDDNSVGVTSNFEITKKLKVPIGIGEIVVRSETKADIFALITKFKK
ncbi:hypothetical protein M2140_000197 [Clostridiales Family XIII bacterium PM5-7]